MARIPLVTDWDFIQKNGDVHCPVCNQPWANAPSVLVAEDEGVALVNAKAFRVTPTQSRVLQVLTAAYGRFLPPEELLFLAFSDRSDADIPKTLSPVSTSLHTLRRVLGGTGYKIEFRKSYGYRFIHQKELEKKGKSNARSKAKPRRRKSVSKPAAKPAARKKASTRSGAKRREGNRRRG